MKITLNYTKQLCIFALYQTPPHLDLTCPQARRIKAQKSIQNFHLFLDKSNVVILSSHLENERDYKRQLINQTSMIHNNKTKQVSQHKQINSPIYLNLRRIKSRIQSQDSNQATQPKYSFSKLKISRNKSNLETILSTHMNSLSSWHFQTFYSYIFFWMYSFRMNANEEQTQMHSTYSKYIYLQHHTPFSE